MNHTDEHLILVPFQFSAPSECALQHAVAVAKAAQDRILLLHVVNSETKDLMKREQLTLKNLYDKLRRLADSISSQHGVAADFEMEEGSIFTTIPEYAEKSKARLIIMGTHGIHGLQHIIGPNALRVSELSSVPDIIVQQRPMKAHGYKTIVVPIDSTRESKQRSARQLPWPLCFRERCICSRPQNPTNFYPLPFREMCSLLKKCSTITG